MVDLPTGQTTMRTKNKARGFIEPSAFTLARKQAGLTVHQAANELDVNVRTIRNYENGAVRIPYPAFRLMRLMGGYALLGVTGRVGDDWAGWSFWRNQLWSPECKGFEVSHLRYFGTYLQIARQALAARSRSLNPANYLIKNDHLKTTTKPTDYASLTGEQPSNATALFGVKVVHASTVASVAVPVCNEKAA